MRGGPTYDKERVSINLARLKKGGSTFEIVINPDAALKYTETQDLKKTLKANNIFFDAKRGELASEEKMQAIFETTNVDQLAHKILTEGEIQLTAEYREQLREKKLNKIITIIKTNAINPQTNTVHPEERIRRALDEARFHINEYKSAEEQVEEALKKLRPILPITFTTFHADIRIPAEYASKAHSTLASFGKLAEEQWLSDGSLAVKVETPAGRYNELVDTLASMTHGTVEITKV